MTTAPTSPRTGGNAGDRPDTRTALLDAAETLFSARGYAAVGIREIVDRAGANIAAINYHFGSKAELYLAAVERAMTRSGEDPWKRLEEPSRDAADAGVRLVRFIRGYMRRLLEPETPDTCGTLMLWEALQPSDAIDSVVREYAKPGEANLIALVENLLAPSEHPRARLYARSILGQILHYRVCRVFIERLDDQPDWEDAADHIVRFSLRAMGHDETFIESTMRIATRPHGDPSRENGS